MSDLKKIVAAANYSYDIYCDDFNPLADKETFQDGFLNGVKWLEKQIKETKEICDCCNGEGLLPDIDGNISSCMNCNGTGYLKYKGIL